MPGFILLKARFFYFFIKKKEYKSEFFNKGDEKRKMKGKAALLPLVMVGILIVAIVGPIQVTAAYEHNWSWLAYTPEAHNWTAFEGEREPHDWSWLRYEPAEHNWSAYSREEEPHNWSTFEGEHEPHDWSWLEYEPAEHNWSAFEGEHEQHNWSWMLPEPGEIFNPNAGWWGH